MGRGLADQLGVVRLSRKDIGLDVTGYILNDDQLKSINACLGYSDCKGQGNCKNPEDKRTCKRKKLPAGHRYFYDCYREQNARKIRFMMGLYNPDSWFITLTFKNFIPTNRARYLAKSWVFALTTSYGHSVSDLEENGGRGLRWVMAQEWQKRHVIHFHLIISGVRLGSLSRIKWESRWTAMRIGDSTGKFYFPCGFARIYEASPEAAPYLAKYVGKTNDPGDALEWGGSWQGITVPDSIRCCKA